MGPEAPLVFFSGAAVSGSRSFRFLVVFFSSWGFATVSTFTRSAGSAGVFFFVFFLVADFFSFSLFTSAFNLSFFTFFKVCLLLLMRLPFWFFFPFFPVSFPFFWLPLPFPFPFFASRSSLIVFFTWN